jgi:hypothetical protein
MGFTNIPRSKIDEIKQKKKVEEKEREEKEKADKQAAAEAKRVADMEEEAAGEKKPRYFAPKRMVNPFENAAAEQEKFL